MIPEGFCAKLYARSTPSPVISSAVRNTSILFQSLKLLKYESALVR
jgi:hypothetical protein